MYEKIVQGQVKPLPAAAYTLVRQIELLTVVGAAAAAWRLVPVALEIAGRLRFAIIASYYLATRDFGTVEAVVFGKILGNRLLYAHY